MSRNHLTRLTTANQPLCCVDGCPNRAENFNELCVGHCLDAHAAAKKIIAEVADRFGHTVTQITGPSLSRCYIAGRREIVLRVREETPLSWKQIGALFGRGHSAMIETWHKATKTNPDSAKRGATLCTVQRVEVVE